MTCTFGATGEQHTGCCASHTRLSELRRANRVCRTRRIRRAREKLANFISILLEEGGHDEVDNVGGSDRALLDMKHGGHWE
jgi:hypothetical protein